MEYFDKTKVNITNFKMKRIYLIFPLFFLLSAPPLQDEDHFTALRKVMVEQQLKRRDITDKRVLEVMGEVKRHLFIDKSLLEQAYNDHPLPIGEGQTISQPYIVALMTQLLNVKPTDKVLEIGTGSGYQAAVLAHLADSVFTIEIKESLANHTALKLIELGYSNIIVKYGDGYFGWKEHAPYDAIIITAAADKIPSMLVDQLKEGGRLLLPLGGINYWQGLTMGTKINGELKNLTHYTDVIFVPMTGEILKKK